MDKKKGSSFSWLFFIIILSFLFSNDTCITIPPIGGGKTISIGPEEIKPDDIIETKTKTFKQSEDSKTHETTIIYKPHKTGQVFQIRINPQIEISETGEVNKETLFESIPENFEKYNDLYNPRFPLKENREFRCYIFLLYQKMPDPKEAFEMYSKFDIIGEALLSDDLLISYWDKNNYPRTDIGKLVISILFPKFKEYEGPFIFFINKHPIKFNSEIDRYVKIDFGGEDLEAKLKFFDHILSYSRKNKITSSSFFWPQFIVKFQSGLRKLFKSFPFIELLNKTS